MKTKKPSYSDLNKIVNAFTVFKFIKDMTTDFVDMPFYRQRIIDKDGNYLKNNSEVPIYYRLIINLKKLINQIPNPMIQAKSKNLVTAITLYAEEIDLMGGDSKIVLSEINKYLESKGLNLTEEMAVGGGAISGVTPVDVEGNPDKEGIPDIFLSKEAQRRHVKNKALLRRKKL
jgi:hypothetical protein